MFMFTPKKTIDLFVYGFFFSFSYVQSLNSLAAIELKTEHPEIKREKKRRKKFSCTLCMHIRCFCTIFSIDSPKCAIRFEKPFTRPLIKIHIGNDDTATHQKKNMPKQHQTTRQHKTKETKA